MAKYNFKASIKNAIITKKKHNCQTLEMRGILAGRFSRKQQSHKETKDAEPCDPCLYTPIKFTAGTLNFIGNVNPLVKVYTHSQPRGISPSGEMDLCGGLD